MSTQAASTRSFAPTDVAYVAVFAALIGALALIPTVMIGAVPFSFPLIGVALAGLCLGPWRGALAVLLYVVAGTAGLPIFSGGKSGPGVLFGLTGGYVVSFVVAALIVGFVARWAVRRGLSAMTLVWFVVGGVIARFVAIMPLGMLGLMRAGGMDAAAAFKADIVFVLPDLLKFVLASLLALSVHKAFPRLLGR
ncbi:MAG TPA: biotin transporter BioY [Tessaracoccus flavescens]|uniref:Biotin transporter n=1 Tax=Tessaracoccus flavescens TaxID=399497 RepID=A0A921ER40_9ACTN|nr:biotin transporter BioY [Tessaracoccus flavescens]